MRRRSLALVVVSCLVWALAGAHVVYAGAVRARSSATMRQQGVPPFAPRQIEVLVIEATGGAGGIDPGLAHLSQLGRPPFSAYTQMSLLSRTVVALGAAPSMVQLPNGNTAAIFLQGRQPNGRFTVRVELTFSGRTHNIVFAASPGDPFFTARSIGPDAARILGFIVR